jgi:hypothetical protein
MLFTVVSTALAAVAVAPLRADAAATLLSQADR